MNLRDEYVVLPEVFLGSLLEKLVLMNEESVSRTDHDEEDLKSISVQGSDEQDIEMDLYETCKDRIDTDAYDQRLEVQLKKLTKQTKVLVDLQR